MYQEESKRAFSVLKDEIIRIHHIGSMAIPGMWAKPIIDILLEVKDITRIVLHNDAMIGLGLNQEESWEYQEGATSAEKKL
jgi:GrpB-like predicted nucleotidyltransferase (UPF0157 family)